MGSVSSLLSGHSFHSKHCRASEYKIRKSSHLKKLNRYSDGLLRFGFSQDSSSNRTKSGKNEDFFYIKVSQKARLPNRTDVPVVSSVEQTERRPSMIDLSGSTPQLVQFPAQLDKGSDKAALRPTAFKPVMTKNSSTNLQISTEISSHGLQQASPLSQTSDQEHKPFGYSVTLSDSGRNSMSSLPTHSTNCSYQLDPLSASVGPFNRFGGSALNITQASCIQQDSNILSLKAMSYSDSGHCPNKGINTSKSGHLSDISPCVHSPVSTDESILQHLEQKLYEKEAELQELQNTIEEKEADTCQLFEEKQKRCREEMEGLKQKCNTRLRQASQKAQKTQHVLQMQIFQLQQEKKKLQENVDKFSKEREQLEAKVRCFEEKKTNLAPTLEETQWEVCQKSGEISLLKQQLKDYQTELASKVSEVLSLKAQLKENKGRTEFLEQQIRDVEDSLRTKSVELEVCENELQRKKNEAELLRDKMSRLEQDIAVLKKDLMLAEDQRNRNEDGKPVKNQSPSQDAEDALLGEVERLKAELMEEKRYNEKLSLSFQQEREIWREEKEKVIRYQKQLQQSYLHMYRKNQELEKVVKQMSVDMEEKDVMDIEDQTASLHYEDIIATEI
ncbi:leucine zipper putative tumor suppressor 1 [Protopterus annectens]|uniref:leucine zipper putative tumor suppressor 1 n=1 Tax=Protopterus annectens TaxID=7888 RepID=UPI001CFB587A|nr:leucine zipper putative tumor suppressor 1 [Protopterus annectens]